MHPFRFHATMIALLIFGIGSVLHAAENAPVGGFVERRGNQLFLDGKPYRAIGVNVPNLHASFAGYWRHNQEIYGTDEAARQAMIRAVEAAAESGFSFIRFFAAPGYPTDIDKLYMRDREAYWRSMDELFAVCAKNHLRLIPSLGCVIGAAGFSDYFEEPARAVFDRQSYSRQALDEYLHDFVTRYKDSPIILMWELQNEAMLAADVPAVWCEEGCFETSIPKRWETEAKLPKRFHGGPQDDGFHYAEIVAIYQERAKLIHSLDPNHLVTSGDAETRLECTSRRETYPDFRYRSDTPEEQIANNLNAQPLPLDVFSYHFYGRCGKSGKLTDAVSARMRRLIRASLADGRPVFIGEIGEAQGVKKAPSLQWVSRWIDEAEKEGVSLLALWVWHFPWQPDLSLDRNNAAQLIKRVRKFNARYARP